MAFNDNNADQSQQPASVVYTALANHQMNEDWDGRGAVAVLRKWTKRFVTEFKLNIPEIVIRVDVLPVSQLGSFRGEHNGLGLQHEVAINSRYLCKDRPRWEPFTTLMHQLLHAWQFSRGILRPTYVHDADYRNKASEIGLVVTTKGLTGCIPGGSFLSLLAANGIEVDPEIILPKELPESERAAPAEQTAKSVRLNGESKLRKYSCGCTNVRVARKEFRALCLLCGNEFASEPARSSGDIEPPDPT